MRVSGVDDFTRTPNTLIQPSPSREKAWLELALRELEAAACLGAAVLLALDDARIAGQESGTLDDAAQRRLEARQCLADAVLDRAGQYDVVISVAGGGLSGQAGAVRHGISKALTYFEPELRPALKKVGFLTRDSRVVERKKYGRAKARRSFQFSKR